MKKKFLKVVFVISLFLSATTLAISQMNPSVLSDLYSQIELFSYALTTIQSEYVEEKTPKDLIYGSLKGMLSSLDPHSQFLEPDDYKELKTETQGKFGGLGIEISVKDGLLTVITPIEDTPAWKVGIKAGDRIVKIEDEVTKDLTLSDAVKKLRGDPGTSVHITVLRETEFKLHDFTIVREIIQVQDVKDVQILEDHIGYIRLAEFREDSHKEFHKGLEQLAKDGADSVILDLRNNPGGLLNVAIEITEEFLKEGELVVTTKGRRAAQTIETFSRPGPNKVLDWPIAILINEGSASGSEILAGALKDNKRAILVGTKSFGKGSVQSVIPLPDGSGLRLTTSKYYTPSGVSIHGKGIEPDVKVELVFPDEEEGEDAKKKIKKKGKEIENVFDDVKLKESNQSPEEIKLSKEQKERRERILADNQVQTAISVIKGVKVYSNFKNGNSQDPAPTPVAAEKTSPKSVSP
ncbi:MAG: S41 family peptidase [Candidatus Omnitrophica bacterium]|nr:S41 family peptidase [Candidatus Omnitrophota bacterium]